MCFYSSPPLVWAIQFSSAFVTLMGWHLAGFMTIMTMIPEDWARQCTMCATGVFCIWAPENDVFDARWTYSTYTWDMWRLKPRSLDWF